MMLVEFRRLPAPDLEHADHVVTGEQRRGERRAHHFVAREVDEVVADHIAGDVVVDAARLFGRHDPPGNALARRHAQRRGGRRKIAHAALHDDGIVFAQHDSADIRALQPPRFVGDQQKDLLQIVTFEDPQRDPLHDVELVAVFVRQTFALERGQREFECARQR